MGQQQCLQVVALSLGRVEDLHVCVCVCVCVLVLVCVGVSV